MSKKLFTLSECFQDYKGASATVYGIYPSYEDAKKHLKEAIEDRFHDYFDTEEKLQEMIKAGYTSEAGESVEWEYDDGDTVTTFYIDGFKVEV